MATSITDDALYISTSSVGDVFSGSVADTSLLTSIHLLVDLIIGGVGTFVVSIFGVLSNVVNCFVFYRQGLRDRMNLCLFSLALADFCFVLCSAIYSLVKVFSVLYIREFGEGENIKTMIYIIGFTYAFKTTSGLYIMVIAVERCVCVAFPFRASSLIRTRTMAMILSTIAFICQLGFIGQSLKYKVIVTEDDGLTRWQIGPSSVWLDNRAVIDTIVYVIFTISVPLITFLTVSLATFITVIQLSSAVAWRQKTSSANTEQNDRQMALTKTLVLASCVFILSMTPFLLTKTVHVFVKEFSVYGLYTRLYAICNSITDIFPVINSSVYIFIYYSRSARYRLELRAVCKCTRQKNSENTLSLPNSNK